EESERAKAKLQESVNSLGETLGSRSERIRLLESTASTQTETVNERAREIERLVRERDAANAKANALDASVTGANAAIAEKDDALRGLGDARAELEKRLSTNLLRAENLERDLAVARAEIAERVTATRRVESERDDQINRYAASEARAVELE